MKNNIDKRIFTEEFLLFFIRQVKVIQTLIKRVEKSSSKTSAKRPSLFLKAIIFLFIVWFVVLAAWGIQRYTHRPGTVYDPIIQKYSKIGNFKRLTELKALPDERKASDKPKDVSGPSKLY